MILAEAGLVTAAYLLGSVPFGLLTARVMGGPDPRRGGSGNIGATNVARLAGKTAGAITLLLDAAKGWLPMALALSWFGPSSWPNLHWAAAAVGLAAFLGHCYPLYLGFKGGKGVATALGVLLAASPLAGLIALAVIAGLAWGTGHMAVGSLAGCGLAPVVMLVLGVPAPFTSMALVMAALVALRHRENIARLRAGNEPGFR